jgi:hypothetical protein
MPLPSKYCFFLRCQKAIDAFILFLFIYLGDLRSAKWRRPRFEKLMDSSAEEEDDLTAHQQHGGHVTPKL